MRFFGLNIGRHDGGIACFDETGELLIFSQTERLSRIKSDPGLGDLAALLAKFEMAPLAKDDLFFNTWPWHYPNYHGLQAWPPNPGRKERSKISGFDAAYQVHFLPHHQCHAASAWLFREQEAPDESLYIVVDGSGYRNVSEEGFYSVGIIAPDRFEERGFNLDKSQFGPQRRLNTIRLPATKPINVAGKLMGMAGYVPQDKLKYIEHPFDLDDLNRSLATNGLSPDNMAICASLYYSYVCDMKTHLGGVLRDFPQNNVVVSGGLFLALELNTWLMESGRRVIFSPAVDDSGIALGSAALGYFLQTGIWPKPLRSPCLQWAPHGGAKTYLSPRAAAGLLANDGVLGVVTGKGEAGPRALGQRSLLAMPTRQNAHLVSVEIKGREFYRPLAPIVTERDFSRWFKGPQGRYMQYRNCCTSDAAKVIPGVVHNDNSSRVQVIGQNDNPWLYELLLEIGAISGAECLINTSLNTRGFPICNTIQDAAQEIRHPRVHLVNL